LQAQPACIKFSSFRETWMNLMGSAKAVTVGAKAAMAYLDKHLRPLEVSPRITVASYWHADEVVRRVERLNGTAGWIVLVGDAACGKPFYLGSNLNGHFQDAMALLAAPWTRWAAAAREAVQHSLDTYSKHNTKPNGAMPFKNYIKQYRAPTPYRC